MSCRNFYILFGSEWWLCIVNVNHCVLQRSDWPERKLRGKRNVTELGLCSRKKNRGPESLQIPSPRFAASGVRCQTTDTFNANWYCPRADDDDDDDDAVTAVELTRSARCRCCTERLAIYSTPMTAATLIMDVHSCDMRVLCWYDTIAHCGCARVWTRASG